MTDITPETPEVELLANGRVRFRIGEQQHLMRRPTIGEFRKMREGLYDLQDEIRAFPQQVEDQTQEITKQIEKAKDEAVLTELREKLRDLNRPGPQLDTLYTAQMRVVCAFAEPPLPEADDDLPLWMASPNASSEFLNHWRDTPLAFGER